MRSMPSRGSRCRADVTRRDVSLARLGGFVDLIVDHIEDVGVILKHRAPRDIRQIPSAAGEQAVDRRVVYVIGDGEQADTGVFDVGGSRSPRLAMSNPRRERTPTCLSPFENTGPRRSRNLTSVAIDKIAMGQHDPLEVPRENPGAISRLPDGRSSPSGIPARDADCSTCATRT